MNITQLSEKQQIDFYTLAHERTGTLQVVFEKDWWVTAVLRALFALPYAEHLSFKGGTSLSKCWNVIERFSEDVDIAVNREYLGFAGELSKTQINDKLRRAACSFVREKLQFDLQKQLEINGIPTANFSIKVEITPISTTDPEIIEIHYKTLFANQYIKPVVKLEIGGRSMNEPISKIALFSILDETFPNTPIAEKHFELNAVVPERTFLEKVCLLHEEFAKPKEHIRVERMSRHLYDLVKMTDTPIADNALKSKELYQSVVAHRRLFVAMKDFDYNTLAPQKIKIVPPANAIHKWKQDYETMQQTMIYGASLPFDQLIEKTSQLNKRINELEWA